jgi:hypothetical protein
LFIFEAILTMRQLTYDSPALARYTETVEKGATVRSLSGALDEVRAGGVAQV